MLVFYKQQKQNTMKIATQDIYLTAEEFERDLEICLTIITEPTKRQPYYVCETSSKLIVHIYINK